MAGIVIVCDSDDDVKALMQSLQNQSLAGVVQHAAGRANALSERNVAQVQLANLLNCNQPQQAAPRGEALAQQIQRNADQLDTHVASINTHHATLHDLVLHEQEEHKREQQQGGEVQALGIRPNLFAHYGLTPTPTAPQLPTPGASTAPPSDSAVQRPPPGRR